MRQFFISPTSKKGCNEKTPLPFGINDGPAICSIQASTDLPQWIRAGSAIRNINGHFNFTNEPNFHFRFYRATN